jgi:hypothetical protein
LQKYHKPPSLQLSVNLIFFTYKSNHLKQKKNLFFILVVVFALTSCSEGEQDEAEATTNPIPSASLNDSTFNTGFQKVLTAYYGVRDGLIEWDTAAANLAAANLAAVADSLDLSRFLQDSIAVEGSELSDRQQDSSKAAAETAGGFAGAIVGSAKALVKEPSIQAKRKEFQMISDALYDLAKSVKYDRDKIYHMKCPMAFNDTEEAYWISDIPEVRNPYLGTKHPKYKNKMLECGEVTDSLGLINNAQQIAR